VLHDFRPDVIFAHHAAFGGFIAAKLAAEMGVPWFVTDHAYDELESCRTNLSRHRHYQGILRTATQWFAVSERMHDIMVDVFPGVPSRTLHNGASMIDSEMLERPRSSDYLGTKMIFCANFFYRRKNIPLTVQAFDLVAEKHPTALFVLAGNGDTEPEVLDAIQRARHKSRIRFLGRLNHTDVLQHMCWADIFISIGAHEPFGVVFSESMMAGTPIIFASDAGIGDMAVSGIHGLGVEPGNLDAAAEALDTLLGDDQLRAEMGRNARQLALNGMTWEANARTLTSIMAEAL
jgi:glycogen(starch) synthase